MRFLIVRRESAALVCVPMRTRAASYAARPQRVNKNIIPHTWKVANIVPIPKPNKDTDKGTSYRPISLLSVIAKTLEKSLLPYITANIPNTPMQHGYKTQQPTVTALHTLNNTVAKGFNQMAPLARTITVALDMSKAFDTINIHTLIRKLLQTNIPGTIIKFIANYINGRKAYTTYRNHTSKQRQIKTGVPQGGVLSPTLFNIYTSDLPPPSAPVQVMAYADDITITSTHTSTSAAKKYIQILGVSPTGVQKLGKTGVKNLGVSSRCAKIGHDRCAKMGHDRCQKLYMTPTGILILGVSPTGVQKLGMTGVKNLGVSDRCAKMGHDRCEKTRCK